mgnify:CR=1 FL=1
MPTLSESMFWIAARQVYEECRRLGLCRSQRDFSRRLLGRGPHYLRLVSNRRAFVSETTTRALRRRLTATVGQVPPDEIAAIFQAIDRANEMARWLRRRA